MVFDIYKRRERLYIKALKLEGRQDREAFKPHLYEVNDADVTISLPRRDVATDIGSRLKEVRTRLGISQKELADKVDLTPSFISQLENNQIAPSLVSFLQICNALGVSPSQFFEKKEAPAVPWLFKKERVFSNPSSVEEGVRFYDIISDERLTARMIVVPPRATFNKHFLYHRMREYIYVSRGSLLVTIGGRTETLHSGDSLYLKESFPTQWRNEGGEEAEILVII